MIPTRLNVAQTNGLPTCSSSPVLGGETVFPNAEGGLAAGLGWRRRKRGGLVVDACAGTLLLFRNVGETGQMDRTSLHESRAVTEVSADRHLKPNTKQLVESGVNRG